MRSVIVITTLLLCSVVHSDEAQFKLAAPAGWGGETITLPPGFARDMQVKGVEHIRFAPGMMKPTSDTFFTYAFAFELQNDIELTDEVLTEEFLKYYRGLCKAVLNGTIPDVDPASFTLKLKRVATTDDEKKPLDYTGVLNWVEPFATKKSQTLNLEIQTWNDADKNFVFACVSPQKRDAEIWKQLHEIRDGYSKKQ